MQSLTLELQYLSEVNPQTNGVPLASISRLSPASGDKHAGLRSAMLLAAALARRHGVYASMVALGEQKTAATISIPSSVSVGLHDTRIRRLHNASEAEISCLATVRGGYFTNNGVRMQQSVYTSSSGEIGALVSGDGGWWNSEQSDSSALTLSIGPPIDLRHVSWGVGAAVVADKQVDASRAILLYGGWPLRFIGVTIQFRSIIPRIEKFGITIRVRCGIPSVEIGWSVSPSLAVVRFQRGIARGDSGEIVLLAQRALNFCFEPNYPRNPVTGRHDVDSIRHVEMLQKMCSLPVTGDLDSVAASKILLLVGIQLMRAQTRPVDEEPDIKPCTV